MICLYFRQARLAPRAEQCRPANTRPNSTGLWPAGPRPSGFVGLAVHLAHMRLDRRRGIFRDLSRRQAGRDALNLVGEVAAEEERHRIALAPRGIDHPMHGLAIAIVGPARDHVAEIDDERSGQRIGVDPSVRALVPNLQTADIVLPQQSHAAKVSVRAGPLLSRPRAGGWRRIM